MKKMAMAKMSMKKMKMAMAMKMGMKKMAMKKSDLTKSKSGKIVSKKASANGKKAFKRISAWTAAFTKARKALNIKGFCPCGGKTKAGQALLAKTRSFYKK